MAPNEGDNEMSRTDTDFKQYVCDSLRQLTDKQRQLDSRVDEHIRLTQEMSEIVVMGKSLFQFAGYLGKFFKWVLTIAAGATLMWQLFGDWVKHVVK